ncbi:MAG: S41 family peptidase [Chitinophagaceae bacterium]|nr:MAG: S41 family peptidase [Chitinophagaceae bacterium]
MQIIKKIKSKYKVIFSIGLVGVLALSIMSFDKKTDYFEINKHLDIFATLYKELNTYYVEPIEPGELMRIGMDAMLESLDPYTNFISESEIGQHRLQTTGRYGGVGAVIRQHNDKVVISEPYENYPAHKAGLKAGDILIQVDDEKIENRNTEQVSNMLRGQAGTTVELTVKRLQADGTYEEIMNVLTREEIRVKNVPFYGWADDGIGYIVLSNFTDNAGGEVRSAIESLQKEGELKGLIFDVRGNPGGLLSEAVNVSNVFIPRRQEIVSTKGKIPDWDRTFRTLNDPVDTELPLVVLTNRGSASASEIVAGSVQDLDRGVVVGRRTFGKGLVQTTRSLPYQSKLKVTTAKYLIPSGRSIQSIDYSNRLDGRPVSTADSLKVPFTTANGRVVFDGTGIMPDVEVASREYSPLTRALITNHVIFDFATKFSAENEEIAPPSTFEITDETYNAFIAFLKERDISYETESERLITELENKLKDEKYMEAVEETLASVLLKIKEDKAEDVYTFREEIEELLATEIVSRYYHRSGKIEIGLRYDHDILKGLEILHDQAEYRALLSPQSVQAE